MQKNKKFLLPIITAISILFSGYIPVMADVDLSTIPAYTGEPYVEINDNVPDFPEDDFTTDSFESYSDLDNLGRCGVAYANIGQDLMPTEKRGSIGQVKPSGWHTQKYDNVDGKFVYNRCHLIGYQLTAENANEKNLITGTRYLNVEGMLPFENMVADLKKPITMFYTGLLQYLMEIILLQTVCRWKLSPWKTMEMVFSLMFFAIMCSLASILIMLPGSALCLEKAQMFPRIQQIRNMC